MPTVAAGNRHVNTGNSHKYLLRKRERERREGERGGEFACTLGEMAERDGLGRRSG